MNSSPQAASDEGCRSRPCGGIPARMSDRVLIKMRAGKGIKRIKNMCIVMSPPAEDHLLGNDRSLNQVATSQFTNPSESQ